MTMLRAAKTVFHAGVGLMAILLAYQIVLARPIQWWATSSAVAQIFSLAALYALLAVLTKVVFRVERSPWRFVSTGDAFLLIRSTATTAVIFLLVLFFLYRAETLPRSVLLLAWIMHLGMLMGARLLRRAIYEGAVNGILIAAGLSKEPVHVTMTLLIVGPVDAAESVLRDLAREPSSPFRPIGVVTPNADHQGKLIRNVPVAGNVEGWDELQLALAHGGQEPGAILFLSDPTEVLSASQLGRLNASEITLLRLPRISEIGGGDAAPEFAGMREIGIEELLSRPPIKLELAAARAFITDKRVMVTGAGGSIGSEICRQVAGLGCAHLTMLDHSEFLLFNIDREIRDLHPTVPRSEVLCNVRDRERLSQWFQHEKPDVIFHAAALKHVPLVETHPDQGYLTNVIGTLNVTDAAGACGASDMVMISTDKAVAPSNIMGATKRLAEAVVREARSETGTRFTVVRFGNVLGSAGSVVPIFMEQIERGGPVTVTHQDVERYFMTIPEAVQLVLHAAATRAVSVRDETCIYVLDMGSPVRVHDLAERMISLSGKIPGKDILIKIIGLRPGEKLTEELVDETEEVVEEAAGVIRVSDRTRSRGFAHDDLAGLKQTAESGDRETTRAGIYALLRNVRTDLPEHLPIN